MKYFEVTMGSLHDRKHLGLAPTPCMAILLLNYRKTHLI